MGNNGVEKEKVNLSCAQCQQRKRKCDRSQPCQACRQAGVECTPIVRARLPRGRHASKHSNVDLRQRVARLESLLSTSIDARQGDTSRRSPYDAVETSETAWMAVSQEVLGIRDLLDSDSPDDLQSNSPLNSDTPLTDEPERFDVLLYGTSSCYIAPSVTVSPNKAISFALLDIYTHRIDPILKLTHVQLLRALLLENSALSPGKEALRFAVYFTAVCSLDEEECIEIVGEEKLELAARLRLGTEVLLSKAGLLSTANLTVLQAFVIYLIGLRTCKGSPSFWTLVATAVRVGQSLGLDSKQERSAPFETEMRRRTWYSIGVLDLQAAFDWGSHSVLMGRTCMGVRPLHVNDSDISPEDTSCAVPKLGFTDMTFPSMTHEMLNFMGRLTYLPLDYEGRPLLTQDWYERLAMVEECNRVLHEKYLQYCNSSIPFQNFTKMVGENMVITMRLLAHRPMHGFYSFRPPPKDDFDILDVALNVLERGLQKYGDGTLRPWKWFAWSKWYALAVLLAELCERTSGPKIDRAWEAVETGFESYSKISSNQVLWSSLEKLMRKARSIKSSSSGNYTRFDESNLFVPNTNNANNEIGLDLQTDFWGEHKMNAISDPEQINASQNPSEDQEMLSWLSWEAFVQDLGDPSQLPPFAEIY